MRNKYHARKCILDGIEFDSRKEAQRYSELLILSRMGKISSLRRQVKFILIPAQYESYERYGKRGQELKPGKRLIEKECAYVADFVYEENGKTVVEDVKGMKTKDYIIKRKLMLFKFDIRIREV